MSSGCAIIRATMLAALPVRSSFPFAVFLGLFVATTVYASKAVAVENAAAETDATEPDEESTEPDTAEANSEQPVASSKEKKAEDGSKGTSHQGQFSLRLAGVAAYRVVMRYDESPLCAAPEPDGEPKKFCGFGAPMGLDTALGYAPLSGVEPFLWGRFGFASESKTHTAPLLVFRRGRAPLHDERRPLQVLHRTFDRCRTRRSRVWRDERYGHQ